jgi:hypothetical protein
MLCPLISTSHGNDAEDAIVRELLTFIDPGDKPYLLGTKRHEGLPYLTPSA